MTFEIGLGDAGNGDGQGGDWGSLPYEIAPFVHAQQASGFLVIPVRHENLGRRISGGVRCPRNLLPVRMEHRQPVEPFPGRDPDRFAQAVRVDKIEFEVGEAEFIG